MQQNKRVLMHRQVCSRLTKTYKDKKAGRGKNTFDNTARYEIEDAGLSDEERFAKIEANLARDENGNPIVF